MWRLIVRRFFVGVVMLSSLNILLDILQTLMMENAQHGCHML